MKGKHFVMGPLWMTRVEEWVSCLLRRTKLLCPMKVKLALTTVNIFCGGWDPRVPKEESEMNDAPIGEDYNRAL